MPIDIVKKNKKNPNVNLRRDVSKRKEEKESLEERLEKRFSHFPELAYQQKVKIMWATVIFCSSIIVVFWFYLASRGVLFRAQQDKEEKDSLIKLSELTSSFNKLKDITVNEISEKKDAILNLKDQLEIEVAKNEVINNLKDNLQKEVEGEYDGELNKVVCDSGNLMATYPLPNYYINNPVKILGRGKLPAGGFKVRLEDSNGKILGESNGTTEKEQITSAFIVELSYSKPETDKGTLQLYTLSEDGGGEDNLISFTVNFISDLSDWNMYNNEEFGIEFKHPSNLTVAVAQDGLFLNKDDADDAEEADKNRLHFDYFSNIEELQEYYTPSLLAVHDNLESFLDSGNLGEKEKSISIGGLEFSSVVNGDVFYKIFERDSGEIAVIKFDNKEILDQVLATFKTIEPGLENWKEYQDVSGEVSFKYPARLNESEELGQVIFREEDPDGFSFYFFAIEPQIDNLEKWIKDSSVNLEEETTKYEDKKFGDVAYGVYYEAREIKDDELDKKGVESSQRSFGYIFNHYGATYSLRTNKENFQNTFKNVLGSIKLNNLEISNQ